MDTSNHLTIAALIALVTGLATSAIVLFNINVTSEQQRALIAGIGSLITIGSLLYGAFIHRGNVQVATAKLYALNPPQPITAELSGVSQQYPYPPVDGDDRKVPLEPPAAA